MFPLTIDDKVQLRPFEVKDAPVLYATVDANRTYLRQWLPWLDTVQAVGDSQRFIGKTKKDWMARKALVLGMWAGEELLGVVSFNTFDWAAKVGAIGYWLAEAAQGKGLITRACSALMDFGCSQLGLKKVTISCAVENKRSQAVPLRLGFVRQAEVQREVEWLYDHWVDFYVYERLAAQ